jgi:hypothetical protein
MEVERDVILYKKAMHRERIFRDRSNPLEMSDKELYDRF